MKYNCEVYNYKCLYPAHWKQYIESEKQEAIKYYCPSKLITDFFKC